MNDAHLFAVARECMLKADYNGSARIGCIAVYKGSILAKGYNTYRTHTEQARYNKWRYKDEGNNYLPQRLHAELSVLRKIKYLDIDFSKVKFYIYRETKDGHLGMARPCPACMAALKQFKVVKIAYSTNDGFAREEIKYGD